MGWMTSLDKIIYMRYLRHDALRTRQLPGSLSPNVSVCMREIQTPIRNFMNFRENDSSWVGIEQLAHQASKV
jgi:hypothetical protein